MQEFGSTFENDDDQAPINYAIFDFGGGTTDYNFGVWKASDSENYDYEIESFGSNGLPAMGGENLLEDLAFEIFKANLDKLTLKDKDKSIQFCFGPNALNFPDADRYISESVEAGKNMHVMMEELRKYWEESEDYLAESDDKTKDNIEFNEVLLLKKANRCSSCTIPTCPNVWKTIFPTPPPKMSTASLTKWTKNQPHTSAQFRQPKSSTSLPMRACPTTTMKSQLIDKTTQLRNENSRLSSEINRLNGDYNRLMSENDKLKTSPRQHLM